MEPTCESLDFISSQSTVNVLGTGPDLSMIPLGRQPGVVGKATKVETMIPWERLKFNNLTDFVSLSDIIHLHYIIRVG